LKAVETDAYPQEILADEEPRYLRRQKPLEIKRRKFGRRAWKTYLRVALWVAAGLAGAWLSFAAGRFLLTSPAMALLHPEQVELTGNHHVSRARVIEIFAADRGRSVLRIPLEHRRGQLEAIPWVEQATVRRALPNKIEVEIVERTPIAFLRQGNDLALVDSHGVILERPLEGNFHFPVVKGITADMPPEERESRMQMYAGFAQQVQAARSGALDHVSQVDLSDPRDLRASLTGLPGSSGTAGRSSGTFGPEDAPLLVRFGEGDFEGKYRALLENIGLWRSTAGRVESVDLRFDREAVVNPDPEGLAPRRARDRASARAVPKAAPKRLR
jgi:cell division protein FtsQ